MQCIVHPANGGYIFKILDSHRNLIGTAHVESKHDNQGKFWDLEDLFIFEKENRYQGYGTTLLDYLKDYLWGVDKLRIRVHPAIGHQAMETLVTESINNQKKYTEEELDEMDRKLEAEMQQPGFWEKSEEMSRVFHSDDLKKWYKNRGFSVTYPSDEKHFWCFPPE